MIRDPLSGTEVRVTTASDDTPDFSDPDIEAVIIQGSGEWQGLESVLRFKETLVPMCAPALASSLRSSHDLRCLLFPGAKDRPQRRQI